MRKPRRNHSAKFKAQVALEAIRGEKTIAEIGAHHEVLENLAGIFGGENCGRDEKERIRELHAKLGELTVERDFLEGVLGKFPEPERQALIERSGKLAVKRQAQLLGLSRSSVYYRCRPVSARDLELMRRIDELHLEARFFGARKIAAQLRREGQLVGRRHVRTLMRAMGIRALYRRPRTSIPAHGATVYPYLLENMVIERPDQVCVTDRHIGARA